MRVVLASVAAVALAACTSSPSGPVVETGALERGDATLTSGEYADRFTARLDEGQWLRVTLDAQGFDPYLVVRFPNGQQSDLDDSTPGDTTSVTMVMRAQEAGQFEILATTFRPGESGTYRLTYEVTDTEPPATSGTVQRGPQEAPEAVRSDGLPPASRAVPDRDLESGDGDAAGQPGEGKPGAPAGDASSATLDA